MWRSKQSMVLTFLFIITLLTPISAKAQEKDEKKSHKTGPANAVLWREPADIETRNLLLGAGGEEMKPDLSKLTFIEQKTGGYSTKFRVRDAAGNEWIAKIGKESQPDTAANRLLWAIGYETEIAYLVPRVTIEGKGEFENVRLEARPKDVKRIGNWKWEDNPFRVTPEFQGLKIMMVLINNWDMKDDNNEILTSAATTGEATQHYIISDLGGTFGKTGGIFTRSRNKPSDYVKADFIEKVKGGFIDFNYGGKNKALFENITVTEAQWLARLLSRLTDEQIKDAFRAANYSQSEVDNLAAAFRERVAALSSLSN
jgi:hypothetical protein